MTSRLFLQKRPDAHKIICPWNCICNPPMKSVEFEDSLLIMYSFSSFWALFRGGGGLVIVIFGKNSPKQKKNMYREGQN